MARGVSKIIETVGTTAIVVAELSELDAVTALNLIYVIAIPLTVFLSFFIALNIWKQKIIHQKQEGEEQSDFSHYVKTKICTIREFFSRDVFLYASNLGSVVQSGLVFYVAYLESSIVLVASAALDTVFDVEGLWGNIRFMSENPNVDGRIIGRMSRGYDAFVTRDTYSREFLPSLDQDDTSLLTWESIEGGDILSHLPRISDTSTWIRVFTEDGP
mgnify:CR=1 FL=1